MKVDGSLKSLLQGVSQQPPRSRLPGQCTEQVNMTSNPVDGLSRRPPLEELASLFTTTEEVQWYEFSLSPTQRFIIGTEPYDIRVFDWDGNEKTVNLEMNNSGVYSSDYLDGGRLSFTTIDGLTYIANSTKEVEMLDDTASYVETGSLVYLLGGQYGRTYRITIDWSGADIVVDYTAPSGGTASDSGKVTTTYIATQLETALNNDATFIANFAVARSGDILYIKKTSLPADESFQVRVQDGDGGVNMFAVNNSVKRASELPARAPQDYVVRIIGSAEADADDWYVRFSAFPDEAGNVPAMGDGFGRDGQWLECVAPGIPYKLDLTTMPVVLHYDADTDEFTLKFGTWKERAVGDEESNEDPSFVGRTIEDIGYFQGRLCMLAGPAVIMSRTDKPDDFWLQSATIVSASDPIDIQSTIQGVQKMYRIVPYNRDLVIFADKGQFIVFGRNQLTPDNASLVLTTAFEADLTAPPVAAGRNVFFAIQYGQYTGIREFFTQEAIDANDSRPVTQHVLKYLQGHARHMASSSNFDILLVKTSQDERQLYVYEYIWEADTKLQSSWSRWTLPNEVKHMFIDGSTIYIISVVNDRFLLNKINLDAQFDTGMDYTVYLDRKMYVTGVNTTFLNPYSESPDADDIVVIQGEGCPYPGLRAVIDLYDPDTSTFLLADDMQGGTVIVGVRYRSSYIPTMPMVKDNDDVKIGTGVLNIGRFIVNTRNSGRMFARIFSKYFSDVTIEYSSRIVGDPAILVGEAPISSNRFIIPFKHNADSAELEIYSDSHEPLTLLDIEWLGQYRKNGQRISGGK